MTSKNLVTRATVPGGRRFSGTSRETAPAGLSGQSRQPRQAQDDRCRPGI